MDLRGFDWKIDKIDLERLGDRIVTVHARRKLPVEGRLVMPKGANAEGLLITGPASGRGISATSRMHAPGPMDRSPSAFRQTMRT